MSPFQSRSWTVIKSARPESPPDPIPHLTAPPNPPSVPRLPARSTRHHAAATESLRASSAGCCCCPAPAPAPTCPAPLNPTAPAPPSAAAIACPRLRRSASHCSGASCGGAPRQPASMTHTSWPAGFSSDSALRVASSLGAAPGTSTASRQVRTTTSRQRPARARTKGAARGIMERRGPALKGAQGRGTGSSFGGGLVSGRLARRQTVLGEAQGAAEATRHGITLQTREL